MSLPLVGTGKSGALSINMGVPTPVRLKALCESHNRLTTEKMSDPSPTVPHTSVRREQILTLTPHTSVARET